MRIKLDNVIYDPKDGIGATPDQLSIEYFGFGVIMPSRVFAKLVPPLNNDISADYIIELTEHIKDKCPIAPPLLIVDFMNGASTPKIVSNEGRNSVLAIQVYNKSLGKVDPKLFVHIFPNRGMRARHLTHVLIENFRQNAITQRSNKKVEGSLFEEKIWFNSDWVNIAEPSPRDTYPVGTPVLSNTERKLSKLFK